MISPISMTPGTKRSNERGQISIFFASSLIVLISIIAFVINIGLFVKAKINLQNATDAGAYSGAAVQARMLNRIGYMNWEMRNVYKEWMFKYWVLGNLNILDVETQPGSANMNFRMLNDPNFPANTGADPYNFPSVCLHYAGVNTNVCRRYGLPGIPRFEPTNLVGIDETTSSFIDAIAKEKASDCSKRTQLNYNVTSMWAYKTQGDETASAFQDAPQIAAERPGAWPKAVELAIRTRSLEFAMNREPVQGICSPNGQGIGSCRSVSELGSEKNYGNERPTKAFWSAYRNLGNEFDTEMKATFTLTELKPKQVTFDNQKSISNILMSADAIQKGKYYLDLKIMMVNYATFFTALISNKGNASVDNTNVTTDASCDVSKIAIPVPGYPLGFFKNPEVLTYYAVKGEANFQGLFNPFKGGGKVKLTSWAAAKPMGGRIGPALFRQNQETLIASRTTANKRRSIPYLSGLNLDGVLRKGTNTPALPGEFVAGMPVPINAGPSPEQRFWIKDATDNVGGWITGQAIVFGVPNLAYDFDDQSQNSTNYTSGTSDTNVIVPGASTGTDSDFSSGLYKTKQFWKFKSNLLATNTPQDIAQAISRARSPTRYEAANYTIPFPSALGVNEQVDGGFVDTFGYITGPKDDDGTQGTLIYAPLYSANDDSMYKNAQDVVSAIKDFLSNQEGAMTKYRNSMNKVALSIRNADPAKNLEAARRISNYDFSLPATSTNPESCDSITGTFLFFYFNNEIGNLSVGNVSKCPDPLIEGIRKYITSTDGRLDPVHHRIEYYLEPGLQQIGSFKELLTGYMPGPMRGAKQNGNFNTPFPSPSETETMRRTGYSTKLIQLNSLSDSGGYGPSGSGAGALATYSEGLNSAPSGDMAQTTLRNALDLSAVGVPSTVNY